MAVTSDAADAAAAPPPAKNVPIPAPPYGLEAMSSVAWKPDEPPVLSGQLGGQPGPAWTAEKPSAVAAACKLLEIRSPPPGGLAASDAID